MVLHPIDFRKLRKALNEGVVNFAFKKLDGTLRTAVGTTDLNRVPSESHPKGKRDSSPKVVVFFDLEKSAWRSLRATQETFMYESESADQPS